MLTKRQYTEAQKRNDIIFDLLQDKAEVNRYIFSIQDKYIGFGFSSYDEHILARFTSYDNLKKIQKDIIQLLNSVDSVIESHIVKLKRSSNE